jgi:hypothetical protein
LGRYDSRFRKIRGGQMTTAPMNPKAGVSGPGKYSVRTDKLEMGSTAYGEGVETQAIKSGAPLAKTADTRPASGAQVRQQAVTSLYAPTERPDSPVTSGIDRGDGLGSDALMMNQPADYTNFNANIQSYTPVLSYIASLQNTSPETRRAIRQLRDSL